jgi:hypothetical protein
MTYTTRRTRGTVYLVHFFTPLSGHARHYLGWVRGGPLAVRMRQARHRAGRGAKILAACRRVGIDWHLVQTWPNCTRADERRLKAIHGSRICPVCKSAAKLEALLTTDPAEPTAA